MDKVDLQILSSLAKDGRLSARGLSHILPISTGTCRRRILRLLASGVSVKALTNPSMLGFPISAFLWFRIEPPKLSSAVEKLASYDQETRLKSTDYIMPGDLEKTGMQFGKFVQTELEPYAPKLEGLASTP